MSSSDWSFNLRTLHPDSEDSDSELQPTAVSEETQLLKDLDLSSRQESVDYKPNPWNIAKINAASRLNRLPIVQADEPTLVAANAGGVATRKKLKSPKGRIVDSFKKQAKRPSATTCAKLKGAAVLKPAVQTSVLAPVRSTDSTRKAQARVPSSTVYDKLKTRTNLKKLNHPFGQLSSSSSLPIASNSVLCQPAIRRPAILSPHSKDARVTKTSLPPRSIPIITNIDSKENLDTSNFDSQIDRSEKTHLNLKSPSHSQAELQVSIPRIATNTSTSNPAFAFTSSSDEPPLPAASPAASESASYPIPIVTTPIARTSNSNATNSCTDPSSKLVSIANSNANSGLSTRYSTSNFNSNSNFSSLPVSFSSPGPAPASYPNSNGYTSKTLSDAPSPHPSHLHQRPYPHACSSPIKPSNEHSTFVPAFSAFSQHAVGRESSETQEQAIWSGDEGAYEVDGYMSRSPPHDRAKERGERLYAYTRAQSQHRPPEYAAPNVPRGNEVPTLTSTVIQNAYSRLNASLTPQHTPQLQPQSQPNDGNCHPSPNHINHNVNVSHLKRLQPPFPFSSVKYPSRFHPRYKSTPFIEDEVHIQSFPVSSSNGIPSTEPAPELERLYNRQPSMPDWLAAVIPARPVAALTPVPFSIYETAALPGSGPAPAAMSRRVYGDAAQYRVMDLDMDVDAGSTQTKAVPPPSQEPPTRLARGRPHYYSHSPAIGQTNNKRRRSRSRSSPPTRPHFPISFNTISRLQDTCSPPISCKDLHSTHPRSPPLRAIQHRHIDAYDTYTGRDPDAEWSTLPSRKKTKTNATAKQQQLGIKQSGRFRMPMLVGGVGTGAGAGKTAEERTGGGDEKRRVVKYLPPPMVKRPNTSEVNGNSADVVLQEQDDSKIARALMKMGDIEKMKNAEMDDDIEAGLQEADIPHGRQQQKIPADSDDPSNAEKQEDDSHSSSPAHRYSSPTLVDSSSPRGSDVHLSVQLDDILNKYPMTRAFMSNVRISILFSVRLKILGLSLNHTEPFVWVLVF
ncbi:hypothetical protein PILCRDRAFT_815310 [Piloderma croceum F 1598]|uniref:Uncharacterized protein n=1 Tax=Piloderma croceum (strain F 1598) TaxID=765440 RepID=A0A0C3G896_PILCF|nr:hypothetical protein PILCRDRAFT_815310 [Piloderma croceum F 1598]